MRVLVVEDERDLASAISDSLRRDGYAVDLAPDAATALSLASVNGYDLICLDLNLPDGDGLDICNDLAAGPTHGLEGGQVPKIIMLTARGAVDDRIKGLDLGADDYLVKPFSLSELAARVRAVLRRDTQTGSSVISYAGIEMDTARHEVLFNGRLVVLSTKEFALLRWFLLHPEEVHSAERLLEHVWDEHADPFTNTVRVTVGTLRRKVTVDDEVPLIETVIGSGYRLRDDVGEPEGGQPAPSEVAK
jgi:DNA-binding response OmpR family regulator